MTVAPSTKLVGKYEIVEELGRGGFAVVYKARDRELDRLVALKVLRPALSDDPGFVARFKQEARAAAGLKHPHIVTVYDAAQIDGQLIIAMQYVEGHTLREELAQGPLPFDQALTILEQIGGALDYAHQRGIVHRDVKPANILLEETPQGVHATLLDFGLAKAMQASTALTSQGTLLGSPEYMAPEQADPDRAKEIGPATDRYALGIVAYQLLTGRVPFPGNTPATLNAHLNLKPTDPRTVRSEVSPQISAILLKMLAKALPDRYASAGEFVQALRSASAPAIHPMPAKSSRRLQAVLVGLLAVLALGVVGYVVTRLIQPAAQPPLATRSASTLMPATPPTTTSNATLLPSSALVAGSLQTRTIDGMPMVYVPGGTFMMGSDSGDNDEKPMHPVTLDGFWIDRTEVTSAQYAQCVATGRCDAPAQRNAHTRNSYYENSQFADFPVVYVDWNAANKYCTWAGGQLPTEAQWEYAARGPNASIYPWGNDSPSDTLLNYDNKIGDTSQVDVYPQGDSWVGALDLAGNVWEWVNDWYGPYRGSSQTNPTGPASGDKRVLRGGSWYDGADDVRSAYRFDITPDGRDDNFGFRCAVRQASGTSTPAPIPTATLAPTLTPEPTLGVGSTRARTTDGMTMVYVPGGTFKMGSETGDDRERPVHDVTLDAFWIDRMEVTNAQYAICVAAGKCGAPTSTKSYTRDSYYGNSQYAGYPVIYVSWINADKYCKWVGGQLPTEAQWEYAARGPDAREYPWGSTFDGTRLNFCDKNCSYNWADQTVDDGYADTAPVGSYPNGVSWAGAFDLAGNVWEWVNDWYGLYPDSNQTNPTGPASGTQKVLRGGSWYYYADGARTAYRVRNTPDNRDNHVGFRCVAAGPGE